MKRESYTYECDIIRNEGNKFFFSVDLGFRRWHVVEAEVKNPLYIGEDFNRRYVVRFFMQRKPVKGKSLLDMEYTYSALIYGQADLPQSKLVSGTRERGKVEKVS